MENLVKITRGGRKLKKKRISEEKQLMEYR